MRSIILELRLRVPAQTFVGDNECVSYDIPKDRASENIPLVGTVRQKTFTLDSMRLGSEACRRSRGSREAGV